MEFIFAIYLEKWNKKLLLLGSLRGKCSIYQQRPQKTPERSKK